MLISIRCLPLFLLLATPLLAENSAHNPVSEDLPEDIDPAEFFDPEEFAAGRRDTKEP